MTNTRLIREDELEIKVGDRVDSILYPGYGNCIVESINISDAGIKIFYVGGGWDWYSSLNKIVDKTVTTIKREIVKLKPVSSRVPLEEERKWPFECGERVWWKTAKTPNQPISELRYATVLSFLTDNNDNLFGVRFEDGGWQSPENIHHIWEPIS